VVEQEVVQLLALVLEVQEEVEEDHKLYLNQVEQVIVHQ